MSTELENCVDIIKGAVSNLKRNYVSKPYVLLYPMVFYKTMTPEDWKKEYIETIRQTGDPNIEIYFINGLYPEDDKYILQKDGTLKKWEVTK